MALVAKEIAVMPSLDNHVSAIAKLGWIARHKGLTQKSSFDEATAWIIANGAPEQVVRVVKAPIGAGPPTDATLSPFGISLGAWSDSARTRSVFYRILADSAFVHMPAYTRIAMMTSAPTGAVTAEGKATAVSKIALNNILLVPEKVTALIVCSETLLREVGAAGQQLFNRELLGAISDSVDAAFLAKLAVGVTPITSSSPLADLRAALAGVAIAGQPRLYWVGSVDTGALAATLGMTKGGQAFAAASPAGGELTNIPFLTASGIASGNLYLINAGAIAVDAASPTVAVSVEADVEMSSTPVGASDVPTAAQMVSMFQTNSVALQSSAYFACEKLRSNAIAVITGISSTSWAAT